MRALVTGSSGFLGRHFVTALSGWDVEQVDTVWGGDLMRVVESQTTVYDLVVHAAAKSPHRAAIDGDPSSHIYNRMLDAALFDWAIRTGQGRVLYLSSCAVLDEIPDDYGRYKLAGEDMAALARRCGLKVTVVRPYSGYGEDQSEDFPFGAFVARAKRREDPFPLWNGGAVRDWIHVDDLVAGALAVAESGTEEPVSLCTGIGTSCGEVARMVCDAAGYAPEFVVQPQKPQGTNQRVGDPAVMSRCYTPKISLADGIAGALGG